MAFIIHLLKLNTAADFIDSVFYYRKSSFFISRIQPLSTAGSAALSQIYDDRKILPDIKSIYICPPKYIYKTLYHEQSRINRKDR